MVNEQEGVSSKKGRVHYTTVQASMITESKQESHHMTVMRHAQHITELFGVKTHLSRLCHQLEIALWSYRRDYMSIGLY